MILDVLRALRSLPRHHYKMVMVTILLPVIGPLVIDYIRPEHPIQQYTLYFAAFLIWSLFAVLAVAAMLKKDRSESQSNLDEKLRVPSDQITKLREDLDVVKADYRQQVDNLEGVVRSTLRDKFGVELPRRPITVNANPVQFSFGVSAVTVTHTRGSRLARIGHWFLRAMRQTKDVVYGKPESG